MTRYDAEVFLADNLVFGPSDITSISYLVTLLTDFAQDSQEIHTVTCVRCDREFRSLESVKYCSQDCEEGRVPMPHQHPRPQAARA